MGALAPFAAHVLWCLETLPLHLVRAPALETSCLSKGRVAWFSSEMLVTL